MSSLDHPYLAPPLALLLSPPFELSLTAFQHSLSTSSSPLPQPLDAPFTLSLLQHLLTLPNPSFLLTLGKHPVKPLDIAPLVTASLTTGHPSPFTLLLRTANPPKPLKLQPSIIEAATDDNTYDVKLLEQYYKREENVILFQMYDILCATPERHMIYSEICKLYNEKYAQTKKRCA
jgi:hypothetical protein